MILDDESRTILDFETHWEETHTSGLNTGRKEEAIRSDTGLTPARYYQLLGRLLEDPGANAYAPQLLARLRRRREAHETTRARRGL